MTERPLDDSGWTTVERHHTALLSLHALTRDPGLMPGFGRMSPGKALEALAQAPLEDVPVSARVGILGDLARADFPAWDSAQGQYLQLAGTVADARDGVETRALLSDLKQAAQEQVPFHTLPTGQALPHHEAAFVAEDVCSVRTVQVGGLRATWVFSEFETDAPFEKIADWVNPSSWPARGPMLFKRMEVVGSERPVSLQAPPEGDQHWHAIFHEEVQLVRRVNTLLHCDFWRDGDRAAGMTYDLALSVDDEIDVDRGFLSVNRVGEHCRVKALKIVGFKDEFWDRMAAGVCPFWTDWVRAAVEGGTSSSPAGGGEAAQPGREETERNCAWLEPAEEWIDFLGESSRTYVTLLDEMAGEAMRPDVRAADMMRHQQRFFSQLAKDWSQAWVHGLGAVAQVADEGLERGIAPPGSTRAPGAAAAAGAFAPGAGPTAQVGAEATVVPVVDLTGQDTPVVSDLVSIEAVGARIPAEQVTTAVERLGRAYGVRLGVESSAWSPGLYVGDVTPRPGADPVPVQLYISRATEV